MIDLYFWPTPNGHKVTLFLEEACLNYQLIPVDITRGEQFKPEFLRISPNNRVPAIVDHDPEDGGEPIAVFESGAILEYLAEKTGLFLPSPIRDRYDTLQWLYWQIGGVGPIGGSSHHFTHYGPDYRDYAVERYTKEMARLYAVLNNRLRGREYINGTGYSIADMACYPWVVPQSNQSQHLESLPELERWFLSIQQRPATVRAYERGNAVGGETTVPGKELRGLLFGQQANH
jgi:GST-like protein